MKMRRSKGKTKEEKQMVKKTTDMVLKDEWEGKEKDVNGRGDYITKFLCLCNLHPAVRMFKKPSTHKTDCILRTLAQKNYKESYDWMVLSELNCNKIPHAKIH
jgi:hypothetical protein